MSAQRSTWPASSRCLTSKLKAVSSATKLPVCRFKRVSTSIVGTVQVVNLPELIVHGAMPLPMRKTGICLEGPFLLLTEGFQ